VFVHLNHLRRVYHLQMKPACVVSPQFGVDLLLRANEHYRAAILTRGLNRSLYWLLRRVIAANCIKNYSHYIPYGSD
jgi:hypothetical protein